MSHIKAIELGGGPLVLSPFYVYFNLIGIE